MFDDKIDKNTKLLSGDIVYIYEYKDRNLTDSFEDLKKVKIIDVLPTTPKQKEAMVTGFFEKINDAGEIIEDKITGFVIYKQNGNFVETSEGLKYINFYIKDKKIHKCLRKIKNNTLFYKIGLILKLKEIAELRIDIFSDILFSSEEQIDTFTEHLKIKKGELNTKGISIEINEKKYFFKDYDIYIGEKMYSDASSKKQIFDYACNNSNSKNEAVYNFNKTFSLKVSSYELEEILI